MQFENLIGKFDQGKVSIQETEYQTDKIAWYEVTEIVKDLMKDDKPSILEYVDKIEMEICTLYDFVYSGKKDLNTYIREKCEEAIRNEYGWLACCKYSGSLELRNDARLIRFTFQNGATMEISNSEWGSVIMGV